jgi:hypothetical protein
VKPSVLLLLKFQMKSAITVLLLTTAVVRDDDISAVLVVVSRAIIVARTKFGKAIAIPRRHMLKGEISSAVGEYIHK